MSRYEPGHPTPPETPPAGHEPLQVSTRALIIFIVVFTVALVAVLAVVAGQYAALSATYDGRGPQPSPLAAVRSIPPAPRVQANEPLQLAQLRQYEETRLHGYSWVDRPSGTVRVPIERAMELLSSSSIAPGGAATQPNSGGAQ